MGQKGTRDEGIDEPVVQSTIIYYIIYFIYILYIYVAAYLDGFFFLKVRYFGAFSF